MKAETTSAVTQPKFDLSDFSAWYGRLVQEKPSAVFNLYGALKEVIVGFEELAFDGNGRSRVLQARLKGGRDGKGKQRTWRFDFGELSDGQRALIVLYTLAFCALDTGATLFIDEPENFIALRELQPLLTTLRDKQEESGGQVILISHHPEFINPLAPQEATIFERQDGAHTRIKPFSMNGVEAITPAELVARGWESDGE